MQEHTIPIGPFKLTDGTLLENAVQRVTIYGDPSARAVLVPHALTGSSRVHEWWGALVGPGKLLDPATTCIIGINALGGCYGSTGPNGNPGFPYVTVKDIVAAQARALEALGIHKLSLVIGASLGGMQALQWALDFPERAGSAVMVGSHDHQSAMGIALNAIQRDAIAIDPALGVRLARKIAMLSYKSDALFKQRHDRRPDRKNRFRFDVEGYPEHQADLFQPRMDPYSYITLTNAMDSFDLRPQNSHPKVSNDSHPEVSKDPEPAEGRTKPICHPEESNRSHPEESNRSHPEESNRSHPEESNRSHPEESNRSHPEESNRSHPEESKDPEPVEGRVSQRCSS